MPVECSSQTLLRSHVGSLTCRCRRRIGMWLTVAAWPDARRRLRAARSLAGCWAVPVPCSACSIHPPVDERRPSCPCRQLLLPRLHRIRQRRSWPTQYPPQLATLASCPWLTPYAVLLGFVGRLGWPVHAQTTTTAQCKDWSEYQKHQPAYQLATCFIY